MTVSALTIAGGFIGAWALGFGVGLFIQAVTDIFQDAV
jgi:hypothetical protein